MINPNLNKEADLFNSVSARIKKQANDEQNTQFWIFYKKNPPKDLNFNSMAKLMLAAAEFSNINETIIQEAIDDVSIAHKEIKEKIKEEKKEEKQEPTNNNMGFDPLSNVKRFYQNKPFFYDKSKIFWLWDLKECKYEIVDETDIMNEIESSLGLYGQTINSKLKAEYLEAFKRVGRQHIPESTPVRWIQFKDKAISLRTNNVYNVTSKYFFTNPIPWEIGITDETPVMDKLFTEWVGEEHVQDLYEILAYCCYREYPIQVMICLYGCGRNGKSQYLKIINKFLGIKNICSTELDLLAGTNSSRFEIFKLYKKLACMMGETNFGILTTTSILKKLVGGDVIGFEKKGKDPFDEYNYAKIIIASNSLPSTDDTSDGFMRRWHIIDFPNEFPEGKDIISTIPEQEYNNLARKICNIIPKLLEKGSFKNQGNIENRKHKYMMASNPLPIFINKYCIKDINANENYNKLYTEYVKYLIKHKKRKVKMKEFKGVLENEGFYVEKTSIKINGEFKSGYYVFGLKMNLDNFDNFDTISNQNPLCNSDSENQKKSPNCPKINDIVDSKHIESPEEIVKRKILTTKDKGWYYTDDFYNTVQDMIQKGLIFESPSGCVRLI